MLQEVPPSAMEFLSYSFSYPPLSLVNKSSVSTVLLEWQTRWFESQRHILVMNEISGCQDWPIKCRTYLPNVKTLRIPQSSSGLEGEGIQYWCRHSSPALEWSERSRTQTFLQNSTARARAVNYKSFRQPRSQGLADQSATDRWFLHFRDRGLAVCGGTGLVLA